MPSGTIYLLRCWGTFHMWFLAVWNIARLKSYLYVKKTLICDTAWNWKITCEISHNAFAFECDEASILKDAENYMGNLKYDIKLNHITSNFIKWVHHRTWDHIHIMWKFTCEMSHVTFPHDITLTLHKITCEISLHVTLHPMWNSTCDSTCDIKPHVKFHMWHYITCDIKSHVKFHYATTHDIVIYMWKKITCVLELHMWHYITVYITLHYGLTHSITFHLLYITSHFVHFITPLTPSMGLTRGNRSCGQLGLYRWEVDANPFLLLSFKP